MNKRSEAVWGKKKEGRAKGRERKVEKKEREERRETGTALAWIVNFPRGLREPRAYGTIRMGEGMLEGGGGLRRKNQKKRNQEGKGDGCQWGFVRKTYDSSNKGMT